MVFSKIKNIHKKHEIVSTFQNPVACFTQGLYIDDDTLYISCGLYGKSSINIFKIKDKAIQLSNTIQLPANVFAEGLTIINNLIYCLTWKSQYGFIIDKKTLLIKDRFYFPIEGWGLTHLDNDNLIISNGTNILSQYNLTKKKIVNRIKVTSNILVINNINELEYVNGLVYANLWQTDTIIVIDYSNGKVINNYHFSNLNKSTEGVLNGIAFYRNKQFLITGKDWNKIYLVNF